MHRKSKLRVYTTLISSILLYKYLRPTQDRREKIRARIQGKGAKLVANNLREKYNNRKVVYKVKVQELGKLEQN